VIEGLLGRKVGMLQVFDSEGQVRGATVIEAGPCLITQIRTPARDGYEAVQLGFGSRKRANKPTRGHLKRLGDLRHLREFKVIDSAEHKLGDKIGAEIFQPGDYIDITGVSKGRGFAGGVKRHGFHGGPKTHGQSDRHRAPGAIGAGNTPGRVFKGMRMAGHMGAAQVTVRGLEVLESHPARGLLIVAGSVPGARNGLLKIRFSRRSIEDARGRKPEAVEPKAQAEEEEAEAPAAEVEETPAAEAEETPEATAEEPAAAGEEAPAEDASEERAEASVDEEEQS
jgi:large subunit ribosomal protein L3